MDKTTYLKNQQVQSFTNWLEYRMNQPNSFLHSYEMLKPKKAWECHSIYNAFEEYEWKFDSFEPQTGEKISGKTFLESSIFLEQLSNGLNESIDQRNEELCKTYCFAILKWGGVLNKNKDRIERISSEYGHSLTLNSYWHFNIFFSEENNLGCHWRLYYLFERPS